VHYNRTIKLIEALPDEPDNKIVWVVYNKDMIANAKQQIIEVKGQDYFDKYVTVTSGGDEVSGRKVTSVIIDEVPSKSSMYFDPMLHAMKGNGYD
jgi:hypothetical protein